MMVWHRSTGILAYRDREGQETTFGHAPTIDAAHALLQADGAMITVIP